MNTYLGAAQDLNPSDIDEAQIAAAAHRLSRRLSLGPEERQGSLRQGRDIAHGAGRQVALTLSDSFCVDRYRDEFLDLMRKGTVDLVFANEAELHSLYQTSDFEGALKQLRADTKLGVVTRSEKGCVVAAKDGVDVGAGVPDSKARRHDRRRRSVRRRLPVRPGAQRGP